MIWLMELLMASLIVKDALSKVLLIHACFGSPFVGDHDDLMGQLGFLFVDMHHGCENVSGMGSIRRVNGCVVGG